MSSGQIGVFAGSILGLESFRKCFFITFKYKNLSVFTEVKTFFADKYISCAGMEKVN